GVLGVLGVTQDAATDTQDHGTMTFHKRAKGLLFLVDPESLQQLAVRCDQRLAPLCRFAQRIKGFCELRSSHHLSDGREQGAFNVSTCYPLQEGCFIQLFWATQNEMRQALPNGCCRQGLPL